MMSKEMTDLIKTAEEKGYAKGLYRGIKLAAKSLLSHGCTIIVKQRY